MTSRPTSSLSLSHSHGHGHGGYGWGGESRGGGGSGREKSYFEQQREALIGEIAMVRFLYIKSYFVSPPVSENGIGGKVMN